MFRLTAAVLVCGFASGCMTTDAVYPVTWAGREKLDSNRCPSIDGDYGNLGDQSRENSFGSYSVEREVVSLAHLLASRAENQGRLNLTHGDAATDGPVKVSLNVVGERLHVVARLGDGSDRVFELPVDRTCSHSMLNAGAAWDGSTTVLVSSVDRSGLKLGRAEDGALLVRTRQSLGFFVTYIPVFGTRDERWLRFPPFKPQSAPPEIARLDPAAIPGPAP